MTIINLTPHNIVLFATDGKTIIEEFPSKGVLRVETVKMKVGLPGFPEKYPTYRVDRNKAGDGAYLPPQQEGVFYLVSMIVQESYPERTDFLSPNTSADSIGAVRDEKGVIIGTKSFVVNNNIK